MIFSKRHVFFITTVTILFAATLEGGATFRATPSSDFTDLWATIKDRVNGWTWTGPARNPENTEAVGPCTECGESATEKKAKSKYRDLADCRT